MKGWLVAYLKAVTMLVCLASLFGIIFGMGWLFTHNHEVAGGIIAFIITTTWVAILFRIQDYNDKRS